MTKKKSTENLPSNAQVEKFDMLFPLVDSILEEMREFAKKKQDGALNQLKVKSINKVLEQVRQLLSNEPIVEFLDLLDNETLPTNSDTVLIVTHYKTAMTQFRDKFYINAFDEDDGLLSQKFTNRWTTKEDP